MTINPFKLYTIHELLKSFVLFLLITVIPIIAIIVAGVQTVLFMIPQTLIVVTIMNILIISVLLFGVHLFLQTLRHYHDEQTFNYKRFFIISNITLSMITLFISYLITGLVLY